MTYLSHLNLQLVKYIDFLLLNGPFIEPKKENYKLSSVYVQSFYYGVDSTCDIFLVWDLYKSMIQISLTFHFGAIFLLVRKIGLQLVV